ncbi:hypothetical protein ACVRXQ_10955 [Streptococcus panodentis]|nr:hypothetical protein [Streptococcus panodentis]
MRQVKSFEQLTALEFYKFLRLRLKTFVVEQDRVYNNLSHRR